MQDIVIVSLNIFSTDPKYKSEYQRLSAIDKIYLIVSRIKCIIKDLEKKEPQTNWIILWRECAISDFDTQFISDKAKNILKQQMEKLTAEYKQLTIISGAAISVKHHHKETYLTKVANIEKYYQKSFKLCKNSNTEAHYKQFKEIIDPENGVNLVRNTVYIFAGGKCINRKDKLFGWDETLIATPINYREQSFDAEVEVTKAIPKIAFQPGNKRNSTSIYEIPINDTKIRCGIEICLEHSVGALSREFINNSDTEAIMLQLVLSAHTFVNLNNVNADYYLLVDSKIRPQLIVKRKLNQSELSTLPVRLYENNVLDENLSINGPLKPIYPEEELRFFERLTNLYQDILNSHINAKKIILSAFSKMILKCRMDIGEGVVPSKIYPKIKRSAEYKTFIANLNIDNANHATAAEFEDILESLKTLNVSIAPFFKRVEDTENAYERNTLFTSTSKKRKEEKQEEEEDQKTDEEGAAAAVDLHKNKVTKVDNHF